MEIFPVGTPLFYADGRTDGHDEGILRTCLKIFCIILLVICDPLKRTLYSLKSALELKPLNFYSSFIN
jgi:hypothetical protein